VWYHWIDDSKPWYGFTLLCDEQDKTLFQVSTITSIGNGKKASFWHDNWLQSKSSKDIAPLLYKLAHFKKRTVEKEPQNSNWIQAVCRIATRDELLQFVEL
jgi:hypothetical protein